LLTEEQWPKWVSVFKIANGIKIDEKNTKTEPIENEGSLLLNHDYDGIELDNNLPPWWVYLFYGCIVSYRSLSSSFWSYGWQPETELKKNWLKLKLMSQNIWKRLRFNGWENRGFTNWTSWFVKEK
jgi:cytochrome c oxidase cbb3-type subunit 3